MVERKVKIAVLLIAFVLAGLPAEGTAKAKETKGSGLSSSRSGLPYRPRWVSIIKRGKIFKYKRKEFSSPEVHGDLVVTGGNGGFFYAMKAKNGRKIWRFKAEGPINSTPVVAEDKVIFGDDKGNLYALNVQNGKEVWRASLGSEIVTKPAIVDGRVFAVTLEGDIAALETADGRVLWVSHFPAPDTSMTILGTSRPVPDEGKIYLGFADGHLRCLSAKEGKTLWDKDLSAEGVRFSDMDASPFLVGDRLYVATFEGPLVALSLKKGGEILWRQEEVGSGVDLAVTEDRLYASGGDGKVYALETRTGNKVWEKDLGGEALTAPLVYQNFLIVGLGQSTINFLNRETGKMIVRRFARKGISSNPVLDQGSLFYLSNGGRLYSLKMLP